ncbi:MAG TPA: phosphotransferase [Acidisarcina sp.]|nr:phosphotransferase [Acidisarcina sp.]
MLGKDAAVKAVAKVPLAEEASGAILNEATILRRLHPLGDLPEVLFQDEQHGIAAQTWLEGKAVSRTFEVAHIDLLSRLAQEDESVRLCDFQSSIAANLDKLDLPLDRSRLGQALDLMDSEEKLPAFIEHRDFTPWNLKRLRSGHFGLLDWEWAVEKGLPWQDICRFFYEQDFLFQGPGKVWETLSSHPLLRTYLRRFDIPADTLPGLTMHYLLRNLCLRVLHMDTTSFDTAAVEYTVQQIEAILDTKARISSKSRI